MYDYSQTIQLITKTTLAKDGKKNQAKTKKKPFSSFCSKIIMKKFSFPIENRWFRFEPKNPYDLVVNASPRAGRGIDFS